jgi:hypothetical protein
MTIDIVDVKAALTESLTELHLPNYERYLLDLVTRESQDLRTASRSGYNNCYISRASSGRRRL